MQIKISHTTKQAVDAPVEKRVLTIINKENDYEKEYNKQVKKLGYLSFVGVEGEQAEVDKFCNNDVCDIPEA